MKTISAHINTNNHRYHKNYDHIAGDINRNASIAQAEYQRDACEEELYRLRYGIERLLANNEQGDFRERYRSRNGPLQNSYRTVTNGITDWINRKNGSWFDRCTPCCRRWRRTRYDDYHRFPPQTQRYSDSLSPSPSYINPTKNDLRQSVDNLFSRNTPDKTNISNLLASKDITDPVYQSLILKILEAKALDCLCTGYSKQNIQQQISQALTEINQRTNDHQWDSASITSSTVSPASYDSSSSSSSSLSVSSNITNDESISSRSITPHSYSPSPFSIPTPNRIPTTSPSVASPLNEENKSSKTKSKVAIIADKKPSSSKSKAKKKTSSKRPKKSSKSKSSKKNPSKSKSSKRKPTSSKSKSKKTSSRSKTHKSKHKKKPKSNNQINDRETMKLSTFIYPQSYQKIYENRQRLLLSPT